MSEKNKDVCVFCEQFSRDDGPANLVFHRGEYTALILNRYPYTSGHLMAAPLRHCADLEALDPATRAEMMELTARCLTLLRREYHPQGFNVGFNLGEAAGAGIADHVHMHIVPRWFGDTNFMSAVGLTRVLPESLEETYARIARAWAAMDADGAD